MILHIPGRGQKLADFGIHIPVAPDKITPVIQALRADPILGPRENEWKLEPAGYEITKEDLLRAHTPHYVDRIFSDEIEEVLKEVYELVDSKGNYNRYTPETATKPLNELADRTFRNIAGAYQCARVALDRGFCFFFGAGAHHAHPGFGHGFCMVNDAVVAVRKVQAERLARQIWIIDVDAHKGDGTADITRDDPTITTLSVHMAHGWPLDGPEYLPDGNLNPAFIPSDIDVPIESGEERTYNERLGEALDTLAGYPAADLAMIVLGSDPYEHDELPSTQGLKLTLEQMGERDRLIHDFLEEREIPQAYIMAGGYGKRAWEPYPQFLIYALRRRLGRGGD